MASDVVQVGGAVDFNCTKSNIEDQENRFFPSRNPRKKEVEKVVEF